MDHRLVAWARTVKARRPRSGPANTPPLWFLTDARRGLDACDTIRRLPAGLCGVVFRDDGEPDRARLGRAVAQACRSRRIPLTVAGDARLAVRLRAGVHLRNGRWPGLPRRSRGWRTSSAHSRADVVRAARAGAQAIFLSPVFATRSHPGVATLGPVRWAAAGRHTAFALGGITGLTARRLPKWCKGAGAIDTFGVEITGEKASHGRLWPSGNTVSQLP